MTDLEMTRLCAEAMGYTTIELNEWPFKRNRGLTLIDYVEKYDPLHDDAQAMALVKKYKLDLTNFFGFDDGFHEYRVRGTCAGWETSGGQDLNRAIVECVAKMQEGKSKS